MAGIEDALEGSLQGHQNLDPKSKRFHTFLSSTMVVCNRLLTDRLLVRVQPQEPVGVAVVVGGDHVGRQVKAKTLARVFKCTGLG